MAAAIHVTHCSLYDVPRAGINIGDGCWGGHFIEHCDVFDTVKETGDHGSFNSWGRDRYWGLTDVNLDNGKDWSVYQTLPFLDVIHPNVLRNNRWRCDHGWDIDLDDGSSNYVIENNLCLNGGIKNREGFGRVVRNNVIVNNTFHPHVWYRNCGDEFCQNIVFEDGYRPAVMRTDEPWGHVMNRNIVHTPGAHASSPAKGLQANSKRDEDSVCTDAMFVNPAKGDYRVRAGSPALALGFKNFPMDQFGVSSPRLRAIARTPELPKQPETAREIQTEAEHTWLGARVRNIRGLSDRSAYGLPDESGVLILSAPTDSGAAKLGLRVGDVLKVINRVEVKSLKNLTPELSAGEIHKISFIRAQKLVERTL
jgi:hypothetical protein